jgi:hypothetical protein
MGKLTDIAKVLGNSNPFAVFGGRRGGKSMAAGDPSILKQLDPQQLSAQLAQLQASQSQPTTMMVPPSLAGTAQTVLGTGLQGGLQGATTTTTGTGSTTWTGTGGTGYAFHSVDEDYAFEEPKKKKYANDMERTIDEEVRRIKNL